MIAFRVGTTGDKRRHLVALDTTPGTDSKALCDAKVSALADVWEESDDDCEACVLIARVKMADPQQPFAPDSHNHTGAAPGVLPSN